MSTGQSIVFVVVGLAVFFGLFFLWFRWYSAGSGNPKPTLGQRRRELLDDWRRQHPDRARDWREQRIKSSALERFTGYPFLNKPPYAADLHILSNTARVEFDGFNALAYECQSYRRMDGGGHRTAPSVRFMVVSIDLPYPTERVAIYRFAPPRYEALFPKLAQRFRLGYPQFDERFYVETSNADFAKRVLAGDLVYWLLNDRHNQALSFTLENGTLNTWLECEFDAEALDLMVDRLVEFYRRIPNEAWLLTRAT